MGGYRQNACRRGKVPLVDKVRRRFLDYWRFGVREGRGPSGLRTALALLLLAGLAGCGSQQRPGGAEDSLTSGRITIVCAPEARDLLVREREAFQALYPQASIEVRAGTAREAVSALFAARCDAAVISRELSPEERAAAVRGGLELEGYRIARDALVAVVHRTNPVQNVSVSELKDVFAGTTTEWSQLAGAGRAIRPVVQPMESDVTGFFIERVMGGEPIGARVITETADSAVVARVSGDPQALGYVTLAWADRGARPLRVSPLVGLPYVRPDAQTVYEGRYPLSRLFNLYFRTGGPRVAGGFTTFITSRGGQKIVQDAGYVPTSVPVRFARRSPMLKSH
jgi:phosphate transport system substrate-binding protein